MSDVCLVYAVMFVVCRSIKPRSRMAIITLLSVCVRVCLHVCVPQALTERKSGAIGIKISYFSKEKKSKQRQIQRREEVTLNKPFIFNEIFVIILQVLQDHRPDTTSQAVDLID